MNTDHLPLATEAALPHQAPRPRLVPVQALATQGARAVHPVAVGGEQLLVVPQLAADVPGQAAQMTLGNSDAPSWVWRWAAAEQAFVQHQRLDIPGGEDAEFFHIGARAFLATASLRTGSGPYQYSTESVIFEWLDGRFQPLQLVPTVAAKQWRHLAIGGRHFLALAQGAAQPGTPEAAAAPSMVFEWDGSCFQPFQTLASGWGYNFCDIVVDGQRLLAYADHTAASTLYRWNGERFELLQVLEGLGGRAFCAFQAHGQHWLAFARLHDSSLLLRWDGTRYVPHQTLGGPGGREWLWLPANAVAPSNTAPGEPQAQDGHLLQVNFLHGTREAPQPAIDSVLWGWQAGASPQLVPLARLPTCGAVDVGRFDIDGRPHLAIASSLNAQVRFASHSPLYRLEPAGAPA